MTETPQPPPEPPEDRRSDAGSAGFGVPGSAQAPLSVGDEKLWAILGHLSIPFFGFIGPLVISLAFRDRSAWLKQVSTEALNFSILYTGAYLVTALLTAVVIGIVLWPLVIAVSVVFCILAALAANRHEFYRYPVNLRFLS